jgi:iron(III) transport system ATP-binding protein
VGTPEDVYDRPADLFVADFVGTANLLAGTVVRDGSGGDGGGDGDGVEVRVEGLAATLHAAKAVPGPLAGAVTVAVRPEAIVVRGSGDAGERLEVADRSFLGDHHRYRVRVGGSLVTVQTTGRVPDDARLTIEIPPGSARAYPSQEHLDG